MIEPPIDSPPVAAAPPNGRVSAIVSWLLIVAACVAMVYLQRKMVDTRADVGQNDAQRENVILRMTSRYALGAARLTTVLPQGPGSNPGTSPGGRNLGAQFAAQLDAAATRPVDYLRVAIVMGELLDNDAAMERVGRVAIAVTDESIARDCAALTTIYTRGPDALTDQQRDDLIERHRWYGRLALTYGLPPGNAQRKAVMAPAMRTVIGAVVFVLAALLAGLVGFVLLIVAVVLLATGKWRARYADHAPPTLRHPAMLEAVATFLVGLIGVSMLSAWIASRYDIDATRYVIWLLPLVLLWPRLRGMDWRDLRMAMGWHRGRGVIIESLCGVTGHIAGLPLLAVGVVCVMLLSTFGYEAAHHPLVDELFGASWSDVVALYILACVWAPLVEESLFRGAFYHHLRRPIGAVLSAGVTGFVFAVIHPQGIIAVPALMSLGFTFAMLREWRGSLVAPIAAHAFNNCAAVTLMLLLLGG